MKQILGERLKEISPVALAQEAKTAQRNMFLSALSILCLVLFFEGGIIALLILLLVPGWLMKLFFLAVYISALFFLIYGLMMATLRTQHHLTETQLHLHFGRALKVAIPRAVIVNAQPVQERVNPFSPLRAEYDTKKRRIIAVFSDRGQILLRLAQPLALKVGRTSCMVESVLINVDQQDEFLTELANGVKGKSLEKVNTARDDTASLSAARPSIQSLPTDHAIETGTPALLIEGLKRAFGNFVAVDDLHMATYPGEIYGFLGPNGAGKTTTIKMLVGLLQPDAGRVTIMGHDMWKDPVAAKARLGYVADRSLLYERLTGRDFLRFLAQMYGLPLSQTEQRINDLLALLDLSQSADQLCGSYSFGMKHKLSLAAALLHQPQVLILDEPLNGLDPRGARRLKNHLRELAAHGSTILFSTHDLATAQEICHRVGIIHKGRLLAVGSATELRQMAEAPDLETVFLMLTEEEQQEVAI